mgnify:CR=1 FL=1
MDYSYKKTLSKGLKNFWLYLFPTLVFVKDFVPPGVNSMTLFELIGYLLPALKIITIGSALVMLTNWLKVKKKLDIP